MAEVFISYSQKDRELVAPIAARLAELGVDAWFDREISAGESFGAVIRARLKEAKAVLVCWSEEAIQSQWVDAEADYAREVGRVDLEARLAAMTSDFEAWLADEKQAAAKRPKPDPLGLAQQYDTSEERTLREENATLSSELAKARATEQELVSAKAEIARVSQQLAESSGELERLREEVASLSDASTQANASRQELEAAKAEVAALSNALAQAKADEGELETAKGEITRLSELLAAEAKDLAALRDQTTTLHSASTEANMVNEKLEAAEAEVARPSEGLALTMGELPRPRLTTPHSLEKQKAQQVRGWHALFHRLY